MTEFPSYSISHWPGCADAKLQAVSTSDRELCAVVAAVAAYEMTGRIYGTLANKDPDAVFAWAQEMLVECNVSPLNFTRWVRAVMGDTFGDTYHLPSQVLGLTLDLYQINCMKRLTVAGGVVGAFMGAGKTAMGTAGAIAAKGSGERCWILCPLNAMPTWERARDAELIHHFKEVRILSVDSAHKYTSVREGDVLIVDEIHVAGSRSSRRAKAMHTIRSRFSVCFGLTGTLVHAGVESALSIKDLTVPGLALFARHWSAGETFHCLVRKDIGSRKVTTLEKPTGVYRENWLAWLSHGVQLIAPGNKEVQAAFQLPGQILHELTLNTPWPSLEEDVARVANAVFAETGEFPHAQAVAHLLARDGLGQKIEWLCGELSALTPSDQLVIFAQYRDSLDGVEEALRDAKLTYVRVDGDVTGADRAEAERKFQSGEAQIFLGQIHAASVAMNLQAASSSITIDVSWSSIDYAQALCRTHRRGQEQRCAHVDLVANVLQARILDRLRSGQDFAAEASLYQETLRGVNMLNTP